MPSNKECETVRVSLHPGWAEIRIDRADKRNALDRATRLGLLEALEKLRVDTRAILLTGTGSSFCAGLDLKEREADRLAGRAEDAAAQAIALNMVLRKHPAVLIAVVNGQALGQGVTLINSCDLALASTSASLACPEISFATYASMAGPTSQLMLNRKRAAWLLLTDNAIEAETALSWGLINAIHAPHTLLEEARKLARKIAGFDPHALRETKVALSTLPESIDSWQAAMEFGQQVNHHIRQKVAFKSPLDKS